MNFSQALIFMACAPILAVKSAQDLDPPPAYVGNGMQVPSAPPIDAFVDARGQKSSPALQFTRGVEVLYPVLDDEGVTSWELGKFQYFDEKKQKVKVQPTRGRAIDAEIAVAVLCKHKNTTAPENLEKSWSGCAEKMKMIDEYRKKDPNSWCAKVFLSGGFAYLCPAACFGEGGFFKKYGESARGTFSKCCCWPCDILEYVWSCFIVCRAGTGGGCMSECCYNCLGDNPCCNGMKICCCTCDDNPDGDCLSSIPLEAICCCCAGGDVNIGR